MSDFCDFVPDDPSCQTVVDPEPAPTTDGGDAGAGTDGGDAGAGNETGGEASGDDMSGKDWSSKDDMKGMTWEEFDEKAAEYFHPMEANIAYFTIAAGFVADIVLRTFVWHEANADTLSQAASGASNTDYYALMH